MKKRIPSVFNYLVPFDEADGEGIVFFGNYFRLAHRALEQFLPTIAIEWKAWFAAEDWGVPLRHVEAEYLQPLRPGDEFTVGVQVVKVGSSSVVFAFEFKDAQGCPVARVSTTHIFVERKTFRKQKVPPALRELLTLACGRSSGN